MPWFLSCLLRWNSLKVLDLVKSLHAHLQTSFRFGFRMDALYSDIVRLFRSAHPLATYGWIGLWLLWSSSHDAGRASGAQICLPQDVARGPWNKVPFGVPSPSILLAIRPSLPPLMLVVRWLQVRLFWLFWMPESKWSWRTVMVTVVTALLTISDNSLGFRCVEKRKLLNTGTRNHRILRLFIFRHFWFLSISFLCSINLIVLINLINRPFELGYTNIYV